jgi:uncharacterized protein
MRPKPPAYGHFREVAEELERSGAAIFRNAEGVESLIIRYPYSINYIHSYAEDSPFFLGLAEGKLRGSRCRRPKCRFVYATPRSHCMVCGAPTEWYDLPPEGRIHSWTTCQFGSEAFLKETPYNLAMVEFDGVGSLLLARIKNAVQSDFWVGMPVIAVFDPNPKYLATDVWFVPKK